jgi:hypothetical protein
MRRGGFNNLKEVMFRRAHPGPRTLFPDGWARPGDDSSSEMHILDGFGLQKRGIAL